jgi:uncharacterized protein YbjT (DUF2867 family)
MKVILYGATGMVGQGVLRECLLDQRVDEVLCVTRRPVGQQHPKLKELVREDLMDYSGAEAQLAGYDACFFTLGVSSAGMTEADYHRVTYDLTMAAAHALVKANPQMTFVFISGAGTDSTEKGRSMWARVKGKTENALLALPFKAAFMFRPGLIRPGPGIQSRTPAYRIFYSVFGWWLVPVLEALLPKVVTSTQKVGRAMIEVAQRGAPKRILESQDINEVAARAG